MVHKSTMLVQTLTPGGGSLNYFEYDNGESGSEATIDWDNGVNQVIQLTADCALTFIALTEGTAFDELLLRIIQDDVGNRLITWPTTVKWSNGTPPTLSTGAGEIDIVQFYWKSLL